MLLNEKKIIFGAKVFYYIDLLLIWGMVFDAIQWKIFYWQRQHFLLYLHATHLGNGFLIFFPLNVIICRKNFLYL